MRYSGRAPLTWIFGIPMYVSVGRYLGCGRVLTFRTRTASPTFKYAVGSAFSVNQTANSPVTSLQVKVIEGYDNPQSRSYDEDQSEIV